MRYVHGVCVCRAVGKAVTLDSAEALRRTTALCGAVNVETTVVKELSSETCFTRNPYLCNLGEFTGVIKVSFTCFVWFGYLT